MLVPMDHPQAIAERYFDGMRAKDVERVIALFAESATLNPPDGRELRGLAAIRQWFEMLFSGAAPSPTPSAYVAGARDVAVEIQTKLADGSSRRTANFFHFDEAGRIERLTSYARS